MFGKEVLLSASQVEKINSLVPKKFKKESWSKKDFKDTNGIYQFIRDYRRDKYLFLATKNNELEHLNKKGQEDINQKILKLKTSKIILFNIEPFEAKPIGMVDIGMVKKFSTTSTGNRFENGMVGYAIEQAFDDVWAKNNAQENALNEVKTEFLKKAASLYPECNMIFKFESDFREMGSTGNVFIYLKGTASIGNHKGMEAVEKEKNRLTDELKQKKEELIKQIETIQEEYNFIQENIGKIPKSKSDIEKMLGK
jgi:hypothetical protein